MPRKRSRSASRAKSRRNDFGKGAVTMEPETAQAIIDVHDNDMCDCSTGSVCGYWEAKYLLLSIEVKELMKFAHHDDNCHVFAYRRSETPGACTCGLEKAWVALRT